jgi:hypothetical protein
VSAAAAVDCDCDCSLAHCRRGGVQHQRRVAVRAAATRQGRSRLVTAFLSRLCLNTTSLPRQARDKYRESTQKSLRFHILIEGAEQTTAWLVALRECGLPPLRRSFRVIYIYKTILLPRQARDKQRESTQQRQRRFLAGAACPPPRSSKRNRPTATATPCSRAARCEKQNAPFFREPLLNSYVKKRTIYQDRLGTKSSGNKKGRF